MTQTVNHRKPRAAKAGFTLIELMVVLVLLALLAGMVAPTALSALRRSGVSSSGEDLVELLRFAQRYAITSHQPVQAEFDSRTGRCRVYSVATAFPWMETGAPDRPEILATLQLPPAIRITPRSGDGETGESAGRRRITFAGDGRAGQTEVHLLDERGGTYAIRVMAADGAILGREGPAP